MKENNALKQTKKLISSIYTTKMSSIVVVVFILLTHIYNIYHFKNNEGVKL